MPRGPRMIPECGIFHIMLRGNNRRKVFFRDCEFRYFKKLLLLYKKKFGFLLYHYALMRNHIHLCIEATVKTDISKLMQGLELSYYHYYKRRYLYIGHLWQGRFKSKIIKTDDQLLVTGIYIEKNPAESGAVKNPIDYEWSSYRYYARGEEDLLVNCDPLYEKMETSGSKCQVAYMQLMLTALKNSQEKYNC